jgi:predicted lipoprotein
MNKKTIWLGLLVILVLSGCKIVPIEEMEQIQQSEEFDPVTYVDGIWESQVIPTLVESAVDLPLVLTDIQADLDAAGEDHAVAVSGGYNFPVKGTGTIISVDDESRNGTAVLQLDDYDGPMTVIVQVGPLIRGDAIRDGVGFISFGDFREQTEFGQVSRELNNRVSSDVIGERDLKALEGKQLDFSGVFTVRTTNQTNIDLSEITITPITFDVSG